MPQRTSDPTEIAARTTQESPTRTTNTNKSFRLPTTVLSISTLQKHNTKTSDVIQISTDSVKFQAWAKAVMPIAPRHHGYRGGIRSTAGASESLTLAEEARQTSLHDHSVWSQEMKLRDMPVVFVSAGVWEPSIAPKARDKGTAPHENHTNTETECNKFQSKEASISPQDATNEYEQEWKHPNQDAKAEASRELEKGNEPVPTNAKALRIETLTSNQTARREVRFKENDSDDEIILFKGRNKTKQRDEDSINMRSIHKELCTVEREIRKPVMATRQCAPRRKKKKNKKARRGKNTKFRDTNRAGLAEEDEMLADYVANIRESGQISDLSDAQEMVLNNDAQSTASDKTSGDDEDEVSMSGTTRAQRNTQASDLSKTNGIAKFAASNHMDWIPPSTQRQTGKARKHKLDLQFADIDSETERRLQAAWQSDRLKKAERKKEREQLRAMKYSTETNGASEFTHPMHSSAMSPEQVAAELKAFLLSSETRLCFPPMEKRERKAVHELANKFNIKSKSTGKADRRQPILYRTKRTLRFNEEGFELAFGQAYRRYLLRTHRSGQRHAGHSPRNKYIQASYRDGEIVGAYAPELGVNNRGRAMLEKMGWSTGTALGSADNKGILQPVTQMMKKSKAGLG